MGRLRAEKAPLLVVVFLVFLFVVMLVPGLSVMLGVLIPVPLTFFMFALGVVQGWCF